MKNKVWFWITIVEFVIIIALCFSLYVVGTSLIADNNKITKQYNDLTYSIEKNGDTSSNTSKNEDSTQDNTKYGPSKKEYALGEEAVISNSDNKPMYSLKIVSINKDISETDSYYTDGKPENTIEVVYEYKNYAMADPMRVNAQFISAFDNNGKTGKTMNMTDGQTEVADGKSSQSKIWIVMPENKETLTDIGIDYSNDFSNGFNGTITFNINL